MRARWPGRSTTTPSPPMETRAAGRGGGGGDAAGGERDRFRGEPAELAFKIHGEVVFSFVFDRFLDGLLIID